MAVALVVGISALASPVTLSNAAAEVEISPEIGRITGWKLAGGENLLWNNPEPGRPVAGMGEWRNHGGDKVWLIPQKLRYNTFGKEIPDPVIDGQPWRVVSQTPRKVVIESGRSLRLNCIVRRTIELDESAPRLAVTTRVERFAASPFPVEIWSVSQAKRPESGILDLAPDLYPEQPRYWQMRKGRSQFVPKVNGNSLEIPLEAKDWEKFNSWGRSVAAVYPDVVFLQEFDMADGGCFPEDSSVQLFVCDDYVEMECFSALEHLKPGGAITQTVRWSILPRRSWKQIGPGGGGRTMWLQPSPGDSSRMLCTGDMGAVFHSSDGGKSWSMNDFEQAERVRYTAGSSPWEFIPARPGEVWTGSKTRGLLRSCDSGASWAAVPGPWEALTQRDWFHSLGPDIVRFSPDGRTGLASWGAFGDDREIKLFITRDGGMSWSEVPLPAGAEALMAVWYVTGKDAVLVGAGRADRLELDSGRIVQLGTAWPGKVFSSAVSNGRLFVAMRGEGQPGKLYELDPASAAARPLPFEIGGRSPGISVIGAARNDDSTLYAGVRGQAGHPATIWKSRDGGKSWKEILFRRPGSQCNISRDRWTTGRWGWTGAPASIGVDWDDPEFVTFSDYTMCGVSRNGGESWEIVSTGPVADQGIPGGGTPMLTGWNYSVDRGRHLVSTTDFATWQSIDGGENWQYYEPSHQVVWHNNFYEIAVDPADRNHLYAAASLKHDLPYWHHLITQQEPKEKHLWRGGVLESEDGGRSWKALAPDESRIPDLPATDLLLDRDGKTLYVASLGGGVFRRNPGEAAFEPLNVGLPEENCNVLRIVRSPSGALYAVVTAKWELEKEHALSGGVFRFEESSGRWEKLPLPADVAFPVNVDFSADGSTLLVSCFQQWRERRRRGGGADARPGLWKADADGRNAVKLLDAVPVYEAKFDPARPGRILAGTVGRGLLVSSDNGRSWERAAGCPPGAVHSITFDPAGDGTVYLTTFGQGFWKGTP